MPSFASIGGTANRGLSKALAIQTPAVEAHVNRLRRTRPDARPADLLAALERHYLSTVTLLGAAVGGTAAAPAVGTGASIALGIGEIPIFLEATALFALGAADIHGVHINDLERRRTLVLAIVLGNSGSSIVEKMAERTGAHWGKSFVNAVPMASINKVNKVLGARFVTKYGATRGILVLGTAVPFGIGAGIGAGGNAAFGYGSVRAARRAFGPPPEVWPTDELTPLAG
jgi:hypothetical protein